MERKFSNAGAFEQQAEAVAGAMPTPPARKSRANSPPAAGDKKGACPTGDDCSQLDNIIGGYGKYQLMIFMFKILIGATSAFNNLGVTFYAPSNFISFWCADSVATLPTITPTPAPNTFLNNISTLSYDFTPHAESYTRNESSSSSIGQLLHGDDDGHQHTAVHHYVQHPPPARTFVTQNIRQLLGDFVFGSPERSLKKQQIGRAYTTDTPHNLRKECDYLSPVDNQRHKCTKYHYDTGIWISTIIDQWDLVCDRALFISVTQSLYMAGFIVSYLVFGYISDRFGRWNSLVLGTVIEILSGFGCAFAGSVRSFMFFRFLLGLGNAGRSSSSYLIMIEWTGQAWRVHISTLGSLGWAIGYCAMPWIVLFFLHFRHMQLFVCFYEIIFLIWLLRLPESPRWLLTHRRFSEAYEVLLMAAKFNGLIKSSSAGNNKLTTTRKQQQQQQHQQETNNGQSSGEQVDEHEHQNEHETKTTTTTTTTLKPYTLEEFDIKFSRLAETIGKKEFSKNEDRLSIVDLFRWPNLRKYSLILAFAWAVNSFIYYGIALRVGDFGATNLFMSFTFAGATELPSIAFTMVCMKFLPRKTTNIFLFSTILFLCALQVPLKHYDLPWAQQVTMMLAKLFNSCSFTCILYQTMELFPTSIRQTAYSSCSLAGRIGSILAPFIKELSQVTNNLVPPVIYAILSVAEIFLIRHLPETQGSDLPDTLLEAESFKGTNGGSKRSTTTTATTSTRRPERKLSV